MHSGEALNYERKTISPTCCKKDGLKKNKHEDVLRAATNSAEGKIPLGESMKSEVFCEKIRYKWSEISNPRTSE